MPYHADFDLDLPLALKGQLVAAFDQLEIGPLQNASIAKVKHKQGVYKLFHNNSLVYVGKADDIHKRLREHFTKISGRINISLNEMGFKCLYVGDNWTTLAPEGALIKHFKTLDEGRCEWNGNGFGPHDPGRERETTNKPAEGFDAKYPIRHDWPCDFVKAGKWNVLALLVLLKAHLPFLLRYQVIQHFRKGHPDQQSAEVKIPKKGMPADALLGLIAKSMPGWQATRFPGHMILYKESKAYSFGNKL